MKKLIKNALLIFTLSLLTYSCDNEDDEKEITNPVVIVDNENSDDQDIVFKFEEGDYNISWEGTPYKTTLTKKDENTLTGQFCLNNSIDNCQEIGPITITRTENTNIAVFEFQDTKCRISADVPGQFDGNGTITRDNIYSFSVDGDDCLEDLYVNNRVILTKI